ncbi:MAG TPA: TolC family protein [Bryobacteraceae bacterium]|nr:TolC family protein [Bryobacteraceae bacterium]
MQPRQIIAALVAWTSAFSLLRAQGPELQRPHAPIFIRPYQGAFLPPLSLKNSDRIYSLIRGGKLYLTVQDALAVAIENNLDLELDRYGPVNAEWTLKRAQGGGPLRGVTAGNSIVNQATSGQGVAGSQVAAGLLGGGGGGGGGGTNAVISQIGPITPNLDPVLQSTWGFFHSTSPQANTVQSQTEALVGTRHVFNNLVQQGLLSGGYVQVAANESYLKENAITDVLNPSVAPVVQIYALHQFLNGFGAGVNSRFIRIAEKNIGAARETFRSQLLNTVATVLNLYWDLVTLNDDLDVRQRALAQAQKVVDDTHKQIELGAVPRVDIFAAEAQLSARRQDLVIAQASVRQQENLLKNALSRNGLEEPLIDAAEVVPLDRIQVPANDELPPLRDLVARALAHRPDVALAKIGDETSAISALGTANGILPTLRGSASLTDVGLAGAYNPASGQRNPAYFNGGLGTALGQIFRHNFPSQSATVLFRSQLQNRIPQGDYGIDQLQVRQGDLIERRNMNEIVVSISNQVTALRQARLRYSQASDSRTLQQELVEKVQQMFSFGTATIADVVAAQQSLLAAQSTEVASSSAYMHARISLDQVLGETLEANHIALEQAQAGRVERESKPPAEAAPPNR